MDDNIETGWLIELEGSNSLCLGCRPCHKVQWTTPTLAVRFAREQDAKAMAEALVPKSKTFVSEHQWS